MVERDERQALLVSMLGQNQSKSAWRMDIAAVLSHARIVLLLEGPGLMTSAFMQDEEILRLLADLQAKESITIFRVPIRSASPLLVPEVLQTVPTVMPVKQPPANMSRAKREAAITKIINELVGAYQVDAISPEQT